MLVSLVAATVAALAPAPLAKVAIDDGIQKHDVATLDWVVAAFLLSAVLYAIASYARRISSGGWDSARSRT